MRILVTVYIISFTLLIRETKIASPPLQKNVQSQWGLPPGPPMPRSAPADRAKEYRHAVVSQSFYSFMMIRLLMGILDVIADISKET